MPVRVGRSRFVPAPAGGGGGQLAAGVRAGPGTVGYLGDTGDLTVLNSGDALPGGWSANWDSGSLVVGASNVTIDHYRINATVTFTGSNPTMTNCIVNAIIPSNIFGVTLNGTGKGTFTITDTTVIGSSAPPSTTLVNGISSDSSLIARRCDVSGTGDGIHFVANPTVTSLVSQCYVHDQAFIDESQHCDGIQIFNHETTAGLATVEHCYIAKTVSTIGTPMNSALTSGTPTADASPLATITCNNNYFASGLFHLRVNFRVQNTVVTNNDWGPLDAVNEFGLISIEVPSAVATWTNNRDSTGTLIPQP